VSPSHFGDIHRTMTYEYTCNRKLMNVSLIYYLQSVYLIYLLYLNANSLSFLINIIINTDYDITIVYCFIMYTENN